MDKEQDVLLMFLKNPEQGQVKTRLAETIGAEKALEVYRQLLTLTKQATDDLHCAKQLWYSKFIPDKDQWSRSGYSRHVQSGVDLGERMKNAFKDAFAADFEKVVIIGSDCANLSSEIIEQAFHALDKTEIVIGPSEDGGYYLLGMSSFYPVLFNNIAWSTSSVLNKTVSIAEENKLSLELLTTLNDIDTEKDMNESGQKLKGI